MKLEKISFFLLDGKHGGVGAEWRSLNAHLSKIYPNVADPRREKTRQSYPDVIARRLGQDEQYLTVREIVSEPSTGVPLKRDYHASEAIFAGVGLQH